jgi:hypothetical protein
MDSTLELKKIDFCSEPADSLPNPSPGSPGEGVRGEGDD